jgi:hypothetical protein
MTHERTVIVGDGLAGGMAAATFREAPALYERPPPSKSYLGSVAYRDAS